MSSVKKILSIIFALMIVFSLVACDYGNTDIILLEDKNVIDAATETADEFVIKHENSQEDVADVANSNIENDVNDNDVDYTETENNEKDTAAGEFFGHMEETAPKLPGEDGVCAPAKPIKPEDENVDGVEKTAPRLPGEDGSCFIPSRPDDRYVIGPIEETAPILYNT